MKTVYLAGPITGLTFEGCKSWREYAIAKLEPRGIRGLSPLRAKLAGLAYRGPAELLDLVHARASGARCNFRRTRLPLLHTILLVVLEPYPHRLDLLGAPRAVE